MRRLWCVMLIVWLSACSAATPTPAATPPASPFDQFAEERERMVDDQIIPRDVTDPIVLQAMRRVPRQEFVPPEYLGQSYENHPLPIGYGQTISQPFIVAYMSENLALKPGDRVLEIGTGSGYQAAVLSPLAGQVYTVEIVPELAARSAALLKQLGCSNVTVRQGDGYLGWPEQAPFDAIMVTAAAPRIPEPLKRQLRDGGRLIIPVGEEWQELVLVTRRGERFEERRVLPVRFVPMTGKVRE
jgi:protein-L-isoaspartate(D-aspartate) O-methyltransferase